jgi:hypothetical protein
MNSDKNPLERLFQLWKEITGESGTSELHKDR